MQLLQFLQQYKPTSAKEERDKIRMIELLAKPDCFHRTCLPGHFTASAWIQNMTGSKALMTHHRKLGRWLQLGGHADGTPDLHSVALREAEEESGLSGFEFASDHIFDIDIHAIPPRKNEPEHLHFDVRFLLKIDELPPIISKESLNLRWVPVQEIESLTTSESVLRLVRKSTKN